MHAGEGSIMNPIGLRAVGTEYPEGKNVYFCADSPSGIVSRYCAIIM